MVCGKMADKAERRRNKKAAAYAAKCSRRAKRWNRYQKETELLFDAGISLVMMPFGMVAMPARRIA